MFKLRKVVLVILLLVGIVTDIASTQDNEVCIPIRRSNANEDGLLNETWVPTVAGPPGARGEIGPPGVAGPVGNPGVCACDPSEIQQIRTELIAEVIKTKEKFANLNGRVSALIDLHEPTLNEIFCTIPPAPEFGSVISSHKCVPINQSIFYTCDEGYVMVGVSSNILVAKCQQNGRWTRETPVCIGPCNPNPCLRGICISQDSNYTCQCPPGYEGRNCSIFNAESCSNTIGMEDKRIKAEQLSASSSHNNYYLPKYARLDLQPVSGIHLGSWLPSLPFVGQWIQVDLMTNAEVVAIITQGHSADPLYGITGFKISYGTSVDQLQVIQDNNGNDVIFQATPNRDGKTRNNFPHPVSARYIRLIVQDWQNLPIVRMEYITC